jgi:AcrR family transcriptional regulator
MYVSGYLQGVLMEPTDTKTRIMDAAMVLFSTNGFNSTTTRSIAERANVNELTIFRHFKTKDNLLSEVIDNYFAEISMKQQIPREMTGDPSEDMYRIITAVRGNLQERKKLFRLMLRELSSNEVVARKLHTFPQMIKGFMMMRFKDALSKNLREDIDIETAGVFFASYFIRSEMLKIMMGEDPFHEIDEKRTREAIDIFLYGALKEERR